MNRRGPSWDVRAKALSDAAWNAINEANNGVPFVDNTTPTGKMSELLLEMATHLGAAGRLIDELEAQLGVCSACGGLGREMIDHGQGDVRDIECSMCGGDGKATTGQFRVVNRTDQYTPSFRNGFLELWSVDDPEGRTIGVVRKIDTSCWSARVYDGKHHSGFAKHRLLGDTDTKGKAIDLILSFHTKRISQDGQIAQAREIISSLLLWLDPAYKPGQNESLENIVQDARAFLWPDIYGGRQPSAELAQP